MKKFKLAIVLLVVGIILVLSGNSLLVYNLLNKEKIDEEKILKSIKSEYKSFKENIELFNDEREDYYDKVSSNLFLETIEEYPTWIKQIDTYTKTIDKIDSDSKYLKNNCVGKSYSDKEILNKCNAFIVAYEESINTYVYDINEFNNKIQEFSKDSKDEKIVEYELKYDMIDINKDGKYEGTE